MSKTKIMFVFGTRPEAIKLAPVILKAKEDSKHFNTVIVVTAQHRQMLDDVLGFFEIRPDYDLHIMALGQSLYRITYRVFQQMENVLAESDPEIVVVQGDTTTTFAAAVAGYYAGKRIAHVEAGLRTGDKWAPFPEEINRKITSVVADHHFAPTAQAKQNLIKEGHPAEKVFITGNTVIDALLWTVDRVKDVINPLGRAGKALERYERVVLITGHRRENFGEPFRRIFGALKALAARNSHVCFVYPVHLNPNVQASVKELLSGIENVFLLPPLPYPAFVWLMQKSHFIITDSGGIQEEAPALGKPVLVTRRVTERPEAVERGVVKVVGDDEKEIVESAQRLLDDAAFYRSMAKGVTLYGDGKAGDRIIACLKNKKFDEFLPG